MKKDVNILIKIADNYSDLLDKDVYEPIILKIMNKSKTIFPEEYTYIVNQSHNESDFKSESNIFYDAKILFFTEQCRALAINTNNLVEFIEYIQREANEIYSIMQSNDENKIKNCIFYNEMIKRINDAKDKENIIIFLPFAFTLESEDIITESISKDIFPYIFRQVIKNNPHLLRNNRIYMIYPSYDNQVIIRNLNEHKVEFLETDILSKYFKIEINN